MRLDPLSLKLFVSVVERGSIAAPRAGHIAPAAVSKRMASSKRRCERRCWIAPTKACDRRGRRGLAELARRLLVDLATSPCRCATGPAHAWTVRVFANISAITQFLPKEIAVYLARYRRWWCIEGAHQLRHRQGGGGNEADVGICLLNAPTEGLDVFPYHEDELVLIVPRGHALSKKRSDRVCADAGLGLCRLHTGSSINLQLARASLASSATCACASR